MEPGSPCRRSDCCTETWSKDRYCSDACRMLDAKDAEIAALKAKVAGLVEALRDAVETVGSARMGSIGGIRTHYCPRIGVAQVERWRSALAAAKEAKP